MDDSYQPEMGQFIFGNEWCDKPGDWAVEDLLRISMSVHQVLGENPNTICGFAGESVVYGWGFDCDVFEMHRYWWGDEDVREASRPNFRHKASGVEIRWYKYIGRGMSSNVEKPDNWNEIVDECILAARNYRG